MGQRGGITSVGISMILVNPARIYKGKGAVDVDVYVSTGDTKLIEGRGCKRI